MSVSLEDNPLLFLTQLIPLDTSITARNSNCMPLALIDQRRLQAQILSRLSPTRKRCVSTISRRLYYLL